MKNVITYRGYTARVEFDSRDNLFVGRVLGLRDSISFHGETAAELRADFAAVIDHYLTDCTTTGRAPERPASGKLMLRVPPEVHTAAALRAKIEGKSLNQWAAEVLAQAARMALPSPRHGADSGKHKAPHVHPSKGQRRDLRHSVK
jgi:predicted HicB family RNase H-like nuclease